MGFLQAQQHEIFLEQLRKFSVMRGLLVIQPLRGPLLAIGLEILADLGDQVECSADESILELHVVVEVGWQILAIPVFPVECKDVHVKEGIIPSIGNFAGLLFDHLLLIRLLILGVHGILIGCKFYLGVGVEDEVALDEVCFEVLQHDALGLVVVYLFLGLLGHQVDGFVEEGVLHYLLPRDAGVSVHC